MDKFFNKLNELKVVPVVVIKNIEDTIPTLEGLVKGGLPVAEITFRTACASEAIKLGSEKFPEMLIGAGTIINKKQAKVAISCGAKFIVSPGFSADVAKVCKKCNIPYLPGCVTPTEIMQALEHGINVVKFFPANIYGGLKAITALAAPFTSVKFMPTGGVNLDNINEFLDNEKIIAVGGSFMMKGDIESNCKELINKISK